MNNLKAFLSLLLPYRKKIAIAFISIVVANLCALAFPWALKLIIDEVLIRKDVFFLNIMLLGLIPVFILKSFSGFMYEYLGSIIGERVVCDLRNKLYWRIHRLSVHYVENTPKGKIISGIIGDVESIKAFLFGGAIDFIYSFFSILFVAVILFILNWRFALIAALYLPILGIIFLKLSPKLKAAHSLLREKYSELTSNLSEALSGIRVVAGFASDKSETDKFSLKQKEVFASAVGAHRLGTSLLTSAEFFNSLGLVALIWFGTRQVLSGGMTAGTLIAFYSYLGMLFYPVIRLSVINNYYQQAVASLERVDEVLAAEPKIKEMMHPIILSHIKGDVRFEDVHFSYDNKREVLSGINLQVQEGETMALVGRSGAGKTTLINLLLRFYDPCKGEIYIDGYRLRDLSLKDYRSKIAMVLQDDYLFGATIKENILYSKPEAGEQDVIRAAKLANAHQFIAELSLGYDTQIGERGVRLSYGQRQRISIARAILREPAILILDEATSSVDSESERLIIEEAFSNLMQGRTTFIIAHRLSSITYANKVVFMEDGKIKEFGSHPELLAQNGDYRRMWMSQNEPV